MCGKQRSGTQTVYFIRPICYFIIGKNMFEDDFDEYFNLYLEQVVRVPKRYIRDMDNILEFYNDYEFKKRFRFNKETVANKIVPLIEQYDNIFSKRGLPLPALQRTLIALRFYATSSYQIVAADLFHVSQPTVCRVISAVSEILALHVNKFVRFPKSMHDFDEVKMNFYRKYLFPGVIGLIDGTQIPIKSPGGHQAEVFRNRKGYFSINVQIVAGPNEEIFDIVARWPGSTHDSRIFENSGIRVKLSEGQLPGHLLGDSGYPQRSYLFTPIVNPQTNSEIRYNNSLIKTRSSVERTIGRWKRRFPCLYFEMQNELKNVQRIIAASAVLYNIGIQAGDLWSEDYNDVIIREVPNVIIPDNLRGNLIRQEFIERHFT